LPHSPRSCKPRQDRSPANERIKPRRCLWYLACYLLAPWSGCRIKLLLDETPKANYLPLVKVSVAYRNRAIPIMAVCYRPDEPPLPLPFLIPWLLRRVAAC